MQVVFYNAGHLKKSLTLKKCQIIGKGKSISNFTISYIAVNNVFKLADAVMQGLGGIAYFLLLYFVSVKTESKHIINYISNT